MKKLSAKDKAELIDSEYRNAVADLGISASELGWGKLNKEFKLYENLEISRNKLCERILVRIFTNRHGLSMSQF